MAGKIDARLAELGIAIPEPRTPSANYIPFVVTGNLVFVSGQVSMTSSAGALFGQRIPFGWTML